MKSILIKAGCFFGDVVLLFAVHCWQPVTAQNMDILSQPAIDSLYYSYRIVTDTSFRWHPEAIYAVLPDMQFEFKLPHEADQSGVANLLFQDRASGEIYLLDTIKSIKTINFRTRYYTLFPQGKYDVILLYNNGKYIRHSDIIFEKGVNSVVNMGDFPMLPADSESQYWLGLRKFMSSVGERDLPENFATDTEKKIRGYLFNEGGSAAWAFVKTLDGEKEGVCTSDGYFEIGVDNYQQTLKFYAIDIDDTQISIKSNSGLFLVFVLSEDTKKLLDSINVRTGPLISR